VSGVGPSFTAGNRAPTGGSAIARGFAPCTRPEGRAYTAAAETPVNGGEWEPVGEE